MTLTITLSDASSKTHLEIVRILNKAFGEAALLVSKQTDLSESCKIQMEINNE